MRAPKSSKSEAPADYDRRAETAERARLWLHRAKRFRRETGFFESATSHLSDEELKDVEAGIFAAIRALQELGSAIGGEVLDRYFALKGGK